MYLRLRDLREDRDKKQKDLADYLGCSQQTYSKYESLKTQLPLQVAIKLALYFNTSIDYLIGLTNDPHPYARSKKK